MQNAFFVIVFSGVARRPGGSSRSLASLPPALMLPLLSRPNLAPVWAACIVGAALGMAACGGEARPPGRGVQDDLGREVLVPNEIYRIVPLAPSATDLVYAAGGGPRLVAAGRIDDYPPPVESLPRFATLPVDFEKIAALAPDLVIASEQVNSPRDAETLHQLGIPTFFLSARSLEDVFANIRTLGRLLGTQRQAGQAVDSLRRRLDELNTLTAGASDRPSVLLLISDEALFAFGAESYAHELVDRAGGRSITETFRTERPVLSDEFVLAAAPEVVIGLFGEGYDARTLLDKHPTWSILPALQSGRVYGIDPSLIQRPGPRLVEGARRIARLLHPELFAPEGRPDPHAP